jgi:hypothetical protein
MVSFVGKGGSVIISGSGKIEGRSNINNNIMLMSGKIYYSNRKIVGSVSKVTFAVIPVKAGAGAKRRPAKLIHKLLKKNGC